MRKKYLVVAVTLFIIFTLSSGALAFIDSLPMLSGADLLMSDWQLDYIRPLEPGELKKGEYRFTPIIGRFDINDERNSFSSSYKDKNNDYDSMLYLMAFDTAVTDNLLLHGKYLYKPWAEYNDFGDENRINFMDLFVDYKLKNDKKMFFGYNRMSSKDKDYDNLDNLNYEDEDTTNFYYLGFEIRGSFLGKNN